MGKVTFVLPAVSDDAVSDWLRALTEAVCKATGDSGEGGLGGSYGYGSNYENDVFMLHRFCWCERGDCAWCRCCDCAGEDHCEDSCSSHKEPEPNFRHKRTGATVHWYKYIGRGMEVSEADWPAIFAECFDSLQAT